MQRTDAHRFEKDPAAFTEGFLHLALNDVRPPITPPPTRGCKRLARNTPVKGCFGDGSSFDCR